MLTTIFPIGASGEGIQLDVGLGARVASVGTPLTARAAGAKTRRIEPAVGDITAIGVGPILLSIPATLRGAGHEGLDAAPPVHTASVMHVEAVSTVESYSVGVIDELTTLAKDPLDGVSAPIGAADTVAAAPIATASETDSAAVARVGGFEPPTPDDAARGAPVGPLLRAVPRGPAVPVPGR